MSYRLDRNTSGVLLLTNDGDHLEPRRHHDRHAAGLTAPAAILITHQRPEVGKDIFRPFTNLCANYVNFITFLALNL